MFFIAGGVLRWVFRIGSPIMDATLNSPKWSEAQEGENPELIWVGDEVIRSDDIKFERLLQTETFINLEDPEDTSAIALDKNVVDTLEKEILKEMIERKLLLSFIKLDNQFDVENPKRKVQCIKDWKSYVDSGVSTLKDPLWSERLKIRLCENSIISQYRNEIVAIKAVVTEEEMREYFNENKAKYSYPERVTLRQIVLPNESEAKKIAYQTKRSNFEHMAKEHSISPEAEDGGLIGPFKKGDLPSVFDIAFRMKIGEISSVQKSTYGFHIIMVVQKYKPEEKSFDDAKDEIKNTLLQEKQEKEYKKWVNTALHTIKINTPKPLW